MKIIATEIKNSVYKKIENNAKTNLKTLTISDEVCFRQNGYKFDFLEKIKSFLFGYKVTPRTFKSSYGYPKVPYCASEKSVAQTNRFLENNYLSFDDKILEGYRDAGRDAVFTKFGDCYSANREVIVIDRLHDKYLNNVIDYVKNNTRNMSEEKKVKYLYKFIQKLGGNAEKSVQRSDRLAAGKEILLGKIFENECACCRHKSLLFKILCEQVGLKASLRRGNYVDMYGIGGHAWNEVRLANGKQFLVDTQQEQILNISKNKVSKLVQCYLDVDNSRLY